MPRAALLVSVSLASAAIAADAPGDAIVEPSYATKTPAYALLTMGPADQCRVWLVADGNALFVDRDGDGALTGADERIALGLHGYFITDIAGCAAKGERGRFRLTVDVGRDKAERAVVKMLSVTPVGDVQDFHTTAGEIPMGASRPDAPRIPIHGPLKFVLMDHWTGSTACRVLPRAGGPHEFSILVATPVTGTAAEAYVYPNLYPLQGEELPDVRVEFQPVDPKARPVSPALRTWFCDCARRYRASLSVPPATESRGGTLTVSFPGWKHGPLAAARFELTYADAPR